MRRGQVNLEHHVDGPGIAQRDRASRDEHGAFEPERPCVGYHRAGAGIAERA
jgi:hypothetical protein